MPAPDSGDDGTRMPFGISSKRVGLAAIFLSAIIFDLSRFYKTLIMQLRLSLIAKEISGTNYPYYFLKKYYLIFSYPFGWVNV